MRKVLKINKKEFQSEEANSFGIVVDDGKVGVLAIVAGKKTIFNLDDAEKNKELYIKALDSIISVLNIFKNDKEVLMYAEQDLMNYIAIVEHRKELRVLVNMQKLGAVNDAFFVTFKKTIKKTIRSLIAKLGAFATKQNLSFFKINKSQKALILEYGDM